MTDDNGIHQGYEDSHIPAAAAVASPQYLLSQILDRLAAVEEEVSALREDNARKDERIAELEKELFNHSLHGHPEMRREIEDLQSQEKTAPVVSQKTAATEGHQSHIKALLLQADHHRLKIKDIAPRLGLTRQQTWNIIKDMERRRMVNVINDPHHRQRKLVELHQQIGTPSTY